MCYLPRIPQKQKTTRSSPLECHIHATWTHSCTRNRDSTLQKRRLEVLVSTHHNSSLPPNTWVYSVVRVCWWNKKRKNQISVFCIYCIQVRQLYVSKDSYGWCKNNANSANINLDRDQWFKEILQRSAESYNLKRETTMINARTLLKNQLNFVISPPSAVDCSNRPSWTL